MITVWIYYDSTDDIRAFLSKQAALEARRKEWEANLWDPVDNESWVLPLVVN